MTETDECPPVTTESKLIEVYETKINKLTETLNRCQKKLKETKRKYKKERSDWQTHEKHMLSNNNNLYTVLIKWRTRARKAERRVRKLFDAAKKRGGSSGGTG